LYHLASLTTGTNFRHFDNIIGLPADAHAVMVFAVSGQITVKPNSYPHRDSAKTHASPMLTATNQTAGPL
jgi:hypothetical protein